MVRGQFWVRHQLHGGMKLNLWASVARRPRMGDHFENQKGRDNLQVGECGLSPLERQRRDWLVILTLGWKRHPYRGSTRA